MTFRTKTGKVLTDADIQALADEAEAGYDVSHLIVHQTKDLKGGEVTTKCGVTGKADKVRHSAWNSEITCKECRG